LRTVTLLAILGLATILNSAYAGSGNAYSEFVTVVASHYGADDGFHGKTTANCTVFDKRGKTAAHKTLPLGTKVKICNPTKSTCETVTITDRGPFKPGRDIDLASEGVARPLGVKEKGVATLKMQVIYVPKKPIMGNACSRKSGKKKAKA
jgi:rare lipoprotein A